MDKLYLVYGVWSGDGNDAGHGNILGVFNDLTKAEDEMIKAARKSFDYYNTPAACRICYYSEQEHPYSSSVGKELYCISDDYYEDTELCLLPYDKDKTIHDTIYAVWGTEDDYYQREYYPFKHIFPTASEAIKYSVEIETKIWDKYNIPMDDRFAWAGTDEDGSIFKIGETNLTSILSVREIKIQ